MWKSLWSQAIPFAWDSTAESNFCSVLCEHTTCHDMGQYGKHSCSLGQDPLISIEAGKYARWMIPSLFAHSILQPLVKFLQSQRIVFSMTISSAITLVLHVPICWALVYKVGLGNKGAALANSISNWLNVALLLVYVTFSPACKKTWTSFSREALYDITSFLKLAIPSAAMVW